MSDIIKQKKEFDKNRKYHYDYPPKFVKEWEHYDEWKNADNKILWDLWEKNCIKNAIVEKKQGVKK